jgi:hypothetical protein
MLTLPPPARNSPARVAKPMTLGPIFRTIAAIYSSVGLTVAGFMEQPVDFVRSHDELRTLPLNPPSEGTTAP